MTDDDVRRRLDATALSDLLRSSTAAGSAGREGAAAEPPAREVSFATLVRRGPVDGPAPSAAIALVLAILLGGIGAHWFYLRRWSLAAGRLLLSVLAGVLYGAGSAYAAAHAGGHRFYDGYDDHTAGFLHLAGGLLWIAAAVWWVIDVVGVARRQVTDAEGRYVA